MRLRAIIFGLVISLLFLYLFVFQIIAIWPFTIDDMYISLRYARHWVSGEGLLWNIHEGPVEGYSNFSFVVLAALALKLHLNPVVFLKWAGLAGLAATCTALSLISRFWFRLPLAFIPSLWLLSYKGQIIWSVSGLETSVYQALLAFSVLFAFWALGFRFYPLKREAINIPAFAVTAFLLTLAAMTRPEAPVFMLLFFVLFWLDKPKNYQKGLAIFGITLAVLYLPYFAGRWIYFGRLFPNSVYCKGFGGLEKYQISLNYLRLFWPFALVAAPALIKFRDIRVWFLFLPSLLYLLLLLGADPVVAFYNRLFLPVFALMLPLSLLGVGEWVSLFYKKKDELYFFIFILATAWIAIFFIPKMSLAQYRFFTLGPLSGEELRGRVVKWLNSTISAEKSIVLGDSGYIPFYSNHRFIDSYCLNNAAMTRYPEKTRYQDFCTDILKAKPEVFILTALKENNKTLYTPADACLREKLEAAGYQKVKDFFTLKKDYSYEVFASSPTSIYYLPLDGDPSLRFGMTWGVTEIVK